jgi:stage V sporulation protein SpoVS
MEPNNETKQYAHSDDVTLLLVKGKAAQEDTKGYVKKLAQAILQVIQKHGSANLRCVGAAALNNAIKAQIIANGEATTKGMNLASIPSFQTITFDDSGEKTSIVIKVVKLDS